MINDQWEMDPQDLAEVIDQSITSLAACAVGFAHKELVERLHQEVPVGDGVSHEDSQRWTAAKQRQLSELRRQMLLKDAFSSGCWKAAMQHITDGIRPVLADAIRAVETQASCESTLDYLNSTETQENNS